VVEEENLTQQVFPQVTHFNASKIFSFAWSPDGKWLSLGSGMNRSDVVLITERH
jgi:hypothetical protein